jgi:hypothetical protein
MHFGAHAGGPAMRTMHFGGHHGGLHGAPHFGMARGGGPRGHAGPSFKISRGHAGGAPHIGRSAFRAPASHERGGRAAFTSGSARAGFTGRDRGQALRSAPVRARTAVNPVAERAFSGRSAQALAARAFGPALVGRRFDPARVRFAGAFWPGPDFFPYAYYDDTFWLWPSAYDTVFWNYGYDDLLYGIYRPYDYDFGVAFGQRGRHARTAQPASTNFAEWCGSTAPGLTDWPIDDIVAAVEPSPEQRALLDVLIHTSDKAAQDLRAACPGTVPVTPIGRLEALEQQLAALRNAVSTVQPALEKFYASLSDDQKERFSELAPNGTTTRRNARTETQSDRLARACSQGSDPSAWPTARIDDVVQPTDSQRAALSELRAATEKAAGIVRSACPTGSALTPTGRLAAMAQRIGALQNALETLRPALSKFYASLNDEQKSRFNRTLLSARREG